MTGPPARQVHPGQNDRSRNPPGQTDPARPAAAGRSPARPAPPGPLLAPSLPMVARGPRRRPNVPAVFVSVLAHALLVALVLLLLHRRDANEPAGREQSVAMVFEPTPSPVPQAPRPGVPELTRPGGMPAPTTPPVPEAIPQPPLPPPAMPEPPIPPAAPPAVQALVPAAPQPPAPPSPQAPAPPQDEVNLQPPPPPAMPELPDMPAPVAIPAAPTPPDSPATPERTPPVQELAGTVPQPAPTRPAPQREAALSPPLLRPPPSRPSPARPSLARPNLAPPSTERPRLRPATPPGSFPAPMNYSFAPPGHAGPQSVARSMLQPPAPTDSQPGLGARSAAGMLETFARAREGDPGPDFYASLKSWWLAHRFYPPQAIEAGEDGDVQISLIVDRQGRVTEVQMESRSGSMWLDMAGQSTWRNAKLLPIPDSMGRDRLTIDLTLHYMLMRR